MREEAESKRGRRPRHIFLGGNFINPSVYRQWYRRSPRPNARATANTKARSFLQLRQIHTSYDAEQTMCSSYASVKSTTSLHVGSIDTRCDEEGLKFRKKAGGIKLAPSSSKCRKQSLRYLYSNILRCIEIEIKLISKRGGQIHTDGSGLAHTFIKDT